MPNCRCLLFFGVTVAVLLQLADSGILSRKQRVIVKRRVVCPEDPRKAVNVKVKLVDEDDGLDPDDDMAEGRTSANGEFQLDGTESEISNIEPRLKIYHDCNDGIKPCQRKWKIKLPDKYITTEKQPTKVLDIGVWNLEVVLPDEERDCVH